MSQRCRNRRFETKGIAVGAQVPELVAQVSGGGAWMGASECRGCVAAKGAASGVRSAGTMGDRMPFDGGMSHRKQV